MSLKIVFPTFLICFLIACDQSEDNSSLPKTITAKPIHSLTTSEAETLLQECYESVSARQDVYSQKIGGKTEPVTRNTDQSYKIRLPSKSYHSLEQRLKHFDRYKTINLNFAFWGSEKTQEGHLSRYVVVWHCSTNGHKITKTYRGPKVKLAQ
ncbi:MAG: hypothetical protein HWE27_05060 [Gammaproteobacteria bacterium]|nr:hypothetical protein [Gammaproteobacteria bacterium]